MTLFILALLAGRKNPDHVSLWGSLILFQREFDQYVNLRPVNTDARCNLAIGEPQTRRY